MFLVLTISFLIVLPRHPYLLHQDCDRCKPRDSKWMQLQLWSRGDRYQGGVCCVTSLFIALEVDEMHVEFPPSFITSTFGSDASGIIPASVRHSSTLHFASGVLQKEIRSFVHLFIRETRIQTPNMSSSGFCRAWWGTFGDDNFAFL